MTCGRDVLVGTIITAALLSGCAGRRTGVRQSDAAGGKWSAEQLVVIRDLNVPECALPDPAAGVVYISNIETSKGEYWGDDGKGFISLLTADGKMKQLRWLDSTAEAPINAPKGMCILGGYLYFTDNSRLMRRAVAKTGVVERLPLAGAKRLNDLATDSEAVYVSDTEAGKVFRVDPDGGCREIEAPPGVNGITFHGRRMYAVSWKLHEVYELDPAGEKAPQPFGLASHFTNLDGIEVMEDGTFIISDFTGNKVSTIAPDRRTVNTLVELESPADIGLDRGRGLLYVPQFMKNRAVVYRLKRK